jgi:hypothetical protein
MICPHCGSSQVTARSWGRRGGGGLGAVAGAFTGSANALSRAEFGGSLGMAARGLGDVLLGALVGAGVGCALGAEAGETFDGTLLHRYVCEACGHTFSL